jgi:hypothetical protein
MEAAVRDRSDPGGLVPRMSHPRLRLQRARPTPPATEALEREAWRLLDVARLNRPAAAYYNGRVSRRTTGRVRRIDRARPHVFANLLASPCVPPDSPPTSRSEP